MLAITPLLTRLYTPGDIGLFQIAFVLGIALAPVLTLRMELFIPASESAVRAAAARLGLVTTGCVGVSAVALSVLALSLGASPPEWLEILVYVVLIASVTGAAAVDSAMLIAEEDTPRLAWRNLLAGMVAAGLQVLAGFVWPNVAAMVLALVLGRFVALALTMRRRRVVARPGLRSVTAVRTFGTRNVGLAIASGLAGSLSPQIGLMAFAAGPGAAAAGQYALAQRSSMAPGTLFSVGLSQHFAMSIGTVVRSGRAGAWDATRRQIRTTWLPGVLIAAVVAAIGLWGFELLFGAPWIQAGIITAILAPALCLQISLAPLSVGFALLERQAWHFYLEAAKLMLNVVVLGGLVLWGIRDVYVLAGAAAGLMFLGHCAFFIAIRRAAIAWDVGREAQ